jgi:hypothetical protein
MPNIIKLLLAFCISILLFSCSNPKADYDTVQKLQDESEKSIQRTTDYDLKVKSCDDAINALQGFLQKYKEGEWNNVAKTALFSWQAKKASLLQELTSLTESLYKLMSDRAIEEANMKHPGSNIEKLQLDDHKFRKEPDKIVFDNVYSVKMRGELFGINVFNFIVKVSGHVLTDAKNVVIDNAVVEE